MSNDFQFNKKYKYSFVGMISDFFSRSWFLVIPLTWFFIALINHLYIKEGALEYKKFIYIIYMFFGIFVFLKIRKALTFNILYNERGVWIEEKRIVSGYYTISWDFIERAYCYRGILPINELIGSYNICVEHIIKEDKSLKVNHIKNGDRLVREINSYLRNIRRGNTGNIIVSEG